MQLHTAHWNMHSLLQSCDTLRMQTKYTFMYVHDPLVELPRPSAEDPPVEFLRSGAENPPLDLPRPGAETIFFSI